MPIQFKDMYQFTHSVILSVHPGNHWLSNTDLQCGERCNIGKLQLFLLTTFDFEVVHCATLTKQYKSNQNSL